MNNVKRVFEALKKQEQWRKRECINLIASENVMSPCATRAYASDFMHRYAEGLPGKRYYQGTKYFDELEQASFDLMKEVYGSRHADTRPVSGTGANLAVYTALVKPGDNFMSPGVPAGGHISSELFGSAGVRGLNVDHFEYDFENMQIDVDKSIEKMKAFKPKLVCLGASMFTLPHPVKEVAKAAQDLGTVLWFDGAHVAGLIAGGEFQQPLQEGASLMTMSTHKTLPGPQGGAIVSNQDDETWKKIQKAVFPGTVSNHHLHKTAALVVTLLEFKEFGKKYAEQTVRNAQALAKALDLKGFNVLWKKQGFTKSHQVVVDVVPQGGGKAAAQRLEEANIILNMNMLPYDQVNKAMNPSGIRMGVQEMTFCGMKEDEMRKLAEIMEGLLLKGRAPQAVKFDVEELRKDFKEPVYCYTGTEAKDLLEGLRP